MTERPKTISIGLAWYEVLLCLIAAVPGAANGSPALGLLCAIAAGIAFGVWRVARILGEMLEYKKLEVGMYDEEPA